jgi:hypothetical protein
MYSTTIAMTILTGPIRRRESEDPFSDQTPPADSSL